MPSTGKPGINAFFTYFLDQAIKCFFVNVQSTSSIIHIIVA